MANATDPLAVSLHGTNPQNLLEKILRLRIYQSRFWKESCFGLTAATLIDKAAALDHVGTTFSANAKPTPFICLLLKLLQIQPAQSIILEYVLQDDYKYLRALGAFYLRLTARAPDVYAYLEPLLNDFRKLAVRTPAGWHLTHMDEFVDELLTGEVCQGVALARLPRRDALVASGALPPRVSPLADLLEEGGEEEGGEEEMGGQQGRPGAAAPPPPPQQQQRPRVGDNRPAWLASGAARPALKRARSESGGGSGDEAGAAGEGAAGAALAPAAAGSGGGGGGGGDGWGEDGEVARGRGSERAAGAAAAAASHAAAAPAAGPKKPVYKPFKLKGGGAAPAAQPPPPLEPDKDSTEYWNAQRAALGLKPLAE
jgi:hypothetical protein